MSACLACSPVVAVLPGLVRGLWPLPSVFPVMVVLAFDLVMCVAGGGGWPEAPSLTGASWVHFVSFNTLKRVWNGISMFNKELVKNV